MERLTDNSNYCTSWADCEMPAGECALSGNCYENKIYNRLREYEDAEEQGLLIRLPCKCDTVVFVAEKGFPTHKALYSCPSAMLDDIEHGAGIGYTREDAEAALEKMNNMEV